MIARLIVPGDAPREEWLAARRSRITASEIAIVLGLSPYGSPYSLHHQKLGTLPQPEETDAMALGKHMESFVAAKFAERYPQFAVRGDGEALYAHQERDWEAATPDRLLFESDACECGASGDVVCICIPDPVAVLECKIDGGADGWGEDGTDGIPVHYRCQVLWQADVLGVTTAYVACLHWQRRQVRVYELTMDDQAQADLKLMRDEAEAFLGCVANRIEPDIDWRPATAMALKQLHPDVDDIDVPVRRMPVLQYRAACKAYKAAEQRKKLAENRLRQLLGRGHRVTDARTGEVIARRDVYDVREHVRRASHVDKLVPVPPKDSRC